MTDHSPRSSMTATALCGLAVVVSFVTPPGTGVSVRVHAQDAAVARIASAPIATVDRAAAAASEQPVMGEHLQARLEQDLAAMRTFRPGYAFWQHIFTIPDGAIAYGSAQDGRLLAVFPAKGDWTHGATWADGSLSSVLEGQRLPTTLDSRRDRVADLIAQSAGPVLHNPTRGQFLSPNVRLYGSFLSDWGAIYERFGVPEEIGLAQVILESGLNGTRRSGAKAVGFCQWLEGNWRRLQKLTPHVIESYNQTTQAPYCAAYLSVLATKYGTFIPALSEHHAGGTNVARMVITGERLGGGDARERYLLGADFARDLRAISLRGYSDLYRTYGPRSYRYAEMVFGNTFTVAHLKATIPQTPVFAMRTPRAIPLAEVTRRTGLSADEVRRFNPALVRQVPARASVYLPAYVSEFGADVSFWRHPPTIDFASVLNDFVRLDMPAEQWDDVSFEPVLRHFQRRFTATRTEEGAVMSTVLAYVIDEAYASRRAAILAEFRTSPRILDLFQRGVVERDTQRSPQIAAAP